MKVIKINRSWTLILLAVLMVLVALWNGLRLVQGAEFWSVLQEYNSHPGPLYQVISAGIWLGLGLATAWGIWQNKKWSWFTAIAGVIGYASWYWIDRQVLQEPHANWPFALGATLVFTLFSLSTLFSPKTRQTFLKDTYERK